MGSSEQCDSNISREFLSKALGTEWNIDSYKVTNGTKPGDNFMSVIYNAEVKAKDKKGNQVTRHLLIKCYPSHPGRQEFTNKSNMFFKELEIYRVWMPELRRFQTEILGLEVPFKLPYAPFVFGKCIDFESAKGNEYKGKVLESLDNYIIMDDVRTSGFRMTNRREYMDLDHMKLVMYELAKVHSMSWAYKNHVEMDVSGKFPCLVPIYDAQEMEMWTDLSYANTDQAIIALDEALGVGNNLSKAMLGFKTTIKTIFDVFLGFENNEEALDSLLRVKHDERFGKDSPDKEPWKIVCHGDCWSNNMLFKYDNETGKPIELILVDLQAARETCVMPDLVYVIYVCTSAELRKKHLNELMELYFNTFNDFCVTLKTETLPGFTMDSFKYRFHRYKLLGLVTAVIGFPIMLKEEEHAEAMNLEDMEHNKNIADIFTDVCRTSGNNSVYKERLIGLVQEMYDEGVI